MREFDSRVMQMPLFEFENGKIAYDFEKDESSSKLLVLVNGYQRTRADFRAFRRRLKALRPEVATLALDNRGIGETQSSIAFNVDQMARDVEALATHHMKELHLPKYSLLGISMGGMISQTVAAQNKNVEHLILVSTTAGGDGRVWPSHVDPSKVKYRPWPQDEEGIVKRMKPYFGTKFLEASPLLFQAMIKNMLSDGTSPKSEKNSNMQFDASRDFDGTGLLLAIEAKTLVVTGTEDGVIPLGNSQYLKDHIPEAQLHTFPEAGHLLLIEEPEKFVGLVSEFMQS